MPEALRGLGINRRRDPVDYAIAIAAGHGVAVGDREALRKLVAHYPICRQCRLAASWAGDQHAESRGEAQRVNDALQERMCDVGSDLLRAASSR